jgi:hypothetical protein
MIYFNNYEVICCFATKSFKDNKLIYNRENNKIIKIIKTIKTIKTIKQLFYFNNYEVICCFATSYK